MPFNYTYECVECGYTKTTTEKIDGPFNEAHAKKDGEPFEECDGPLYRQWTKPLEIRIGGKR